jgi:hypothetical protein
LNWSCPSRKSSLTPVWNVRIASTASSYRACTAAFERLSSALAFVCTTRTADSPITPATIAAAAPVTFVRFRSAHRRARLASGSRQAETGSSAIHRSRSSDSAFGEAYRSSGRCAIARRQTASSARSILASCRRGGRKSPRRTAASTSPTSPATGGRPVSR